MNILDGARIANRKAFASAASAASSSTILVGTAASVLSIKDAILGTKSIEQERVLRRTIKKIRVAALRTADRKNRELLELDEAESSILSDLASGAKTLVLRGLAVTGTWFVSTLMAGVTAVVVPAFRLLSMAVSMVFRLVLTNPYVIGALTAAGTAYLLYRKFSDRTTEPVEAPKVPETKVLREVQPSVYEEVPSQSNEEVAEQTGPEVPLARPVEEIPKLRKTAPEPAEEKSAYKVPEKVKKLKPLGKSAQQNKAILMQAMTDAGMTDPRERAAFLAQMHHESAGFSAMEERGGAAYFARYDGRKNLGNTEKGDGARYKGRGFIQLTGRANYAIYGKSVGVDLINNPHLAADPEIAAKVAIAYWNARRLGPKARRGDFDAVTKGINGGYNGKADRDAKYAAYLQELGVDPVTSKVESKVDSKEVGKEKDSLKGVSLFLPTYGRVSSSYGARTDPYDESLGTRQHKGIDIAAPKGTPVFAATDGKAVVRTGVRGYGNLLEILGKQFLTRYAHLDSFGVQSGEAVKRGQEVGRVGNTGRSTGPHLHFEVRSITTKEDIDPASVMKIPGKIIEKHHVVPSVSPSNTEVVAKDGRLVKLER